MIVYSAPVSDVVRSVAIVRHEILVAGGIALLLALVGGYLLARALAQRVKRLERAAEQVAAGDFEHPIRVDSTDELGQLAVAFNDMQRQLRSSSRRARSSSRPPRTSCGRRSSRSAGFVELLEDEDLDPETGGGSSTRSATRSSGCASCRSTSWICPSSRPDRSSCATEQVDLGELTRAVSGEFEPTLAQHDSHLELRLRRGGSRRSAIPCGSPRSCGS